LGGGFWDTPHPPPPFVWIKMSRKLFPPQHISRTLIELISPLVFSPAIRSPKRFLFSEIFIAGGLKYFVFAGLC